MRATIRVLPFLAIVAAVLYSMYGGLATPTEASAVGAILCLLLAILVYRMWRFKPIKQILRDTLNESAMVMLIIGTAQVFAFTLSALFITQTLAAGIADLELNRWVLMGIINVFLFVCGLALPPVAVIVMTAPILMPVVLHAGFGLYWFAVIMTINMELALISPPVSLNLFIINGIAPEVSLTKILIGTVPYQLLMVLMIILLCVFPSLATTLPQMVIG